MLVSPVKGTQIVTDSERTINDVLMQLVCRPATSYNSLSRTDLVDLLEEIADLRFGDPPYPRMAGFYSGPLYWDVFGPDPAGNVAYRMERQKHAFNMIWITRDVGQMMAALHQFHRDFAYQCETGGLNRTGISALIDTFIRQFTVHP